MGTTLIAAIAADNNTEFRVYAISTGYSVAMYDVDADRGMAFLLYSGDGRTAAIRKAIEMAHESFGTDNIKLA